MKFWLISDEDVKVIGAGLNAITHEANDYNCQDWPIGEGCCGCQGDELREKARYAFDMGLHATEEIPDDFKTA